MSRFVDVEDPAARGTHRVDIVAWATWTLIVGVLARSHEMWRDELQAWAIARESSWPWEIIANTSYEGHPPAWHLLLWPATFVSRAPGTAQVVGLACASAAVWLILRYMPFTLPVRLLLVFGYFPLYEMGVVTRGYALMFLLVVAFVVVADRRPLPLWPLVAISVVMALTLVLAVPLVAALAVGTAVRHRKFGRRTVAAGFVIAASVLLSIELSRTTQGDGRRVSVQLVDPERVQPVLDGPLRIIVPWSEFTGSFWGHFLSDRLGSLESWIGVVILVGVAVAVARSVAALLIWSIGALGYLAATQVFSLPMEPRQLTVLWLTLVAAVWTAGSEVVEQRAADALDDGAQPGARRGVGSLATRAVAIAALLAGVGAVIWPIGTELRYPFSGGEGAAEWIRTSAEADSVILCAVDMATCSTVSIRLDEPAYFRADGESFTFVEWRSGWRRGLAPDLVAAEARRLAERLSRPVVVVALYSNHPPGCDRGWVSTPTIAVSERIVVCRADQLLDADVVGN